MVGEFDGAGIMGENTPSLAGEDAAVATAIRDTIFLIQQMEPP